MEDYRELMKVLNSKAVVKDGDGNKIVSFRLEAGRPVIGKIAVLKNDAALNFSCDDPWAAISLSFNKVAEHGYHPAYGHEPLNKDNRVDLLEVESNAAHGNSGINPFSSYQAIKIKEFLDKNWSKIDVLMIRAGVCMFSTAIAIGRAISDAYHPEYSECFAFTNPYVHGVMLEALTEWEKVEVRCNKQMGTWLLSEHGFKDLHYPGKHYAMTGCGDPIREDVRDGDLCLLTGQLTYWKKIQTDFSTTQLEA